MAKRKLGFDEIAGEGDNEIAKHDFTDIELHRLFTYSPYDYVGSIYDLSKAAVSTAGIETVPIGVLQPLFRAIDDLYGGNEVGERAFTGGHIGLVLHMCEIMFLCCFSGRNAELFKHICYRRWISTSAELQGFGESVKRRSRILHLYKSFRRAVFCESNETVLELKGCTENRYMLPFSMDEFRGYRIDDIIPALVGLVLWKDGNISPDVQWLQQDANPTVRGTTHRFTEVLRPLCRCFRDLKSDEPVTKLFSTRRACTRRQIEFLADKLQGSEDSGGRSRSESSDGGGKTLQSTLQSFMSTSSSQSFVTVFREEDLILVKTGLAHKKEVPGLEITFTVDERAQDKAFFIPVWSFLKEHGEVGPWTESEYLMLPGTEVVFSDLVCANPVPSYSTDAVITMAAKVVGFDPDLQKLKSVPLVHERIAAHDQFVDHVSRAVASMLI